MSTTTTTIQVDLCENMVIGSIQFIGNIQDKQHIFYGIKLDEARGTMHGNIGTIKYFNCGINKGLLVQKTDIVQTITQKPGAPRVTIGDKVQCLSARCNGTVRFIGTPFSIKKRGTFYGIELNKPRGKNNGTVGGRSYFKCEYNHGVFLTASGFKVLRSKRDMLYTVGDTVKVISHGSNAKKNMNQNPNTLKLDTENNRQHQLMFNRFVDIVYKQCIEDFKSLNGFSPSNIHSNDVQQRVLNDHTKDSILSFYRNTLESLDMHTLKHTKVIKCVYNETKAVQNEPKSKNGYVGNMVSLFETFDDKHTRRRSYTTDSIPTDLLFSKALNKLKKPSFHLGEILLPGEIIEEQKEYELKHFRRKSDTLIYTPIQTQLPFVEEDELLADDDALPVIQTNSKRPRYIELKTPVTPMTIWQHHSDADHVSTAHQKNKEVIDKLLGFKGHSWDFDNDCVAIFNRQCYKVNYALFVPPFVDIVYPTMLSSLALPSSTASVTYYICVKYCLSTFVSMDGHLVKYSTMMSNDSDETQKICRIQCEFSFKTTVKMAIEDILHKIKKNHAKYSKYICKLRTNCFLLKVCGREEYLKYDDENHKIISMTHIRNCIRRQETQNMQLVLLYDDSLRNLNDKTLRDTLRQSYNYYHYSDAAEKRTMKRVRSLKYESRGYNVITKTLVNTIGDTVAELHTNIERFNDDIEQEVLWLQKKIGHEAKQPSTADSVVTQSTFTTELDTLDWNNIDKKAVLLSTFDHRIELMVKSLQNINSCPRFESAKPAYCSFNLRIELMFGVHTFKQCSWNIAITNAKISNNMQFLKESSTFSTKDTHLSYSSLPQEAIWCFTLYGIKKDVDIEQQLQKQDKKKKKKQPKILRASIVEKQQNNLLASNESKHYISEPIAWCRLPLIDAKHCLNKGEHILHLWTVPIFTKVKSGPKIDPYTTDNWKKFGSTRDCNTKPKQGSNPVTLCVDFALNYAFDIVAPIVNPRRPHYLQRKIRSRARKHKKNKQKKAYAHDVLHDIIQRDGILPLDERDKLLVYSNKEKLMTNPSAIATFLRSVNWLDAECRMEAYDYLFAWSTLENPCDIIELLRYEFADARVRLYAIACLNHLDDYALSQCLLQLVQALKNESHHSSFLSRFLIVRALHSPFQIGHYLFWYLKSEYHDHNLQFIERYGLLLREYMTHLPFYPSYTLDVNLAQQLYDEHNLVNRLNFISLTIKSAKQSKAKKKYSKQNLQKLLHHELNRLNDEWFAPKDDEDDNHHMILPLNPSYKVCGLRFEQCRFMNSAQVPLWLVFETADSYCDIPLHIMFKSGDDLRQDILTLQLMSMMDAIWLSESIDLNMRLYEVIGTGFQTGMLELIMNSKTINNIQSALYDKKSHLKYIDTETTLNKHLDLNAKQANYARSVAGFSVATWTLGIGDRHPDNIMLHENGTLFHIDFGHFLGNFKEKDIGGLVKWKRERTPFVFTNAMKYCIKGYDKHKQSYTQFVEWLFDAFQEIRKHYKLFLNLLLLMVPSQIPELITEADVSYFKDILRFDLADTESIAKHVEQTLKLCISDKNKTFDDIMHKIHHL